MQRRKNFTLLIFLFLATLGNSFSQTPPETKTALLEAASAAVRVSSKAGKIWENYWSPKQSFIIYKEGDSAILVSKIAPTAEFQLLEDNSLPRELRGKTYFHQVALPGLAGNFNTDYKIGGISAIAVKLEKNTYKTLEVLFHEGFHKYQNEIFARTVGADAIRLQEEKWISPEIISKPEFVASMELERCILARAVNTNERQEIVTLLRQYLEVRSRRYESLPIEVRQAELNIERKEGTATIVGNEIAFLATGQNRRTLSEQIKMFLAEPPKSLPMGNFPYERFRARAFGSGAAIAWLLTRLKTNWREQSQQGISFQDLLAKAIKFKPEDSGLAVETARQQFDYSELLKDAETWKSKVGSGFTAADFYQKGKIRLIVEFPSANKKYPEVKGQGAGLPSQPEENVVIFPTAKAVNLDYQQITLSGENRPYMLDFTRAPKLYRITIMLDELPTIEGRKTDLSEIQWNNGGTLEGAGIKLKVERPTVVSLGEGTIKIQVKELP